MQVPNTHKFHSLTTDLDQCLQATAAAFCANQGLSFRPADLAQMTTSSREVAAKFLMFGAGVFPDSQPLPSPQAAWIRPMVWALSTLLYSIPLGILLVQFLGFGSYILATLGVIGTALVFGPVHAAMLSIATPFATNLFVVGAPLEFDAPTHVEFCYAIFYLVLAISVPFIARHAYRFRLIAN